MPFRVRGSVVTAVLAVAACLAIGTATWAVASDVGAPVPSSAGPAPSRDCTTLTHLTEQTMNSHYTGPSRPFPVYRAGEGLIYYDNIYDASNRVFGHVVGFAVATYTRPSDGHLIAQYREVVELPGGTLSTVGTVDRTGVFEGATARFTVTGTSGKYLGMTGTREWSLAKIPPTASTRTNDTFVLCR